MLYRQAKVKRIQYNQTSFTTNAEGTSLDRTQEKERPTENNPKQENGNRIIYVNNYLKYKWTKCTNQKT